MPTSQPPATQLSASGQPAALVIRPLLAGDHEDWLRLWQGYLTFYRSTLPATTVATTWRRLLDPGEPMAGALALLDGQPLGLVHWIYHRSCWTEGDYCYLQDLFVAAEHRGAGLGRRLIEHVYQVARDAGCSRVHWLTHETNHDAMKLYDRIGERSGFIQYRKLFP